MTIFLNLIIKIYPMKKYFCILSILIVTFSSCQDSAAKKINSSSAVAKTNQISQEPAADGPVMTFEKTTHDFGTINEGDKVTTQFSFTNTGKADLIIVMLEVVADVLFQNIKKRCY